jgi:hypothetical protein
MSKTIKIEIEIPEPPEGWVVDGHRKAVAGEMVLFDNRQWSKCQYSETYHSYLVCVKAKPLWEPSPELAAVLQPGWIARDSNDFWYWYKGKPLCGTHMWLGDSSRSLNAVRKELLSPTTIPWDQCCFKIGEPE